MPEDPPLGFGNDPISQTLVGDSKPGSARRLHVNIVLICMNTKKLLDGYR